MGRSWRGANAVGIEFGTADAVGSDASSVQQAIAVRPWLADYAFVIRDMADIEALLDAEVLAVKTGVDLLSALFIADRISQFRYTAALARTLQIVHAGYDFEVEVRAAAPRSEAHVYAGSYRCQPARIICATAAHPGVVSTAVSAAGRMRYPTVLATGRAVQSALERADATTNLRTATLALKRRQPIMSAGRAGPSWQPLGLAVVIGLLIGAAVSHPHGTLAFLTVMLTVPFVGSLLVRLCALAGLFRRSSTELPTARVLDHDLPVYSIMVALYDEADVLPSLIAALTELDYPATKLDCLLAIEDSDIATKAALLAIDLPSFMRVVVVPDGEPRTKPRALNYALALARGTYVVIYDAEDRPERDQLRRALATFQAASRRSAGHPPLACVQACLNIFNARQSWLTRQFTVEYSALFDSILPALQRLRLPMPLGGTSNHFTRAILVQLDGWDPYNVTEDADLGIRIARSGYCTAMVSSTTWEEAPATFQLWLRQRTRWLKGWMQTYLVHTRQPFVLQRELGFARTLGFHLYLGGLILSALVHPLFYLAVVVDAVLDIGPASFGATLGPILWWLSAGNLIAGYLAAIVIGAVAARRRGHHLTLAAALMPVYWMLISLAAYRALWQLYRDPYLWEKTPHGLAEEDDRHV